MKLDKKKSLASRTLGVGKNRIMFVESRLDDIKDALTKDDIRDLVEDKAIVVKNRKGRRKIKKKVKKSTGNIRKKINKRKQEYVKLTRKLRKYVKEMTQQGKINKDEAKEIRKRIRNKDFRSKANLKEYIGGLRS